MSNHKRYYRKGYPCREREDKTSHWNELGYLKRVRGQISSIMSMCNPDKAEHSCKEILNQLLAASTQLKNIGFHIFKRHWSECLKKDGFPGTEEERQIEIDRALELLKRLGIMPEDDFINFE